MARKRRITSQEVAKRAGVSRTTVSFVLNDVPGTNISDETRERVLRAARELGYVPNEAARSLASGQTRNIGLVINQSRNQFLADAYIPYIIYGVSEVTGALGFRVLLDWVEDIAEPDAYLNLALAKKIDGILLCSPRADDEQLQALIADGFPVVVVGNLPDSSAHLVAVDERSAAKEAVEYLIGLGHKRIACISNAPVEYISTGQRVGGYRAAMKAAKLPLIDDLIHYGSFTPESGYASMKSVLASEELPTAVFVASDIVALGAMTAIRESGFSIPHDISIVGFDDVSVARFVDPPLTTVHLPAVQQGQQAMRMLNQLIQGEKPEPQQVTMKTNLVIRHSCRTVSVSE